METLNYVLKDGKDGGFITGYWTNEMFHVVGGTWDDQVWSQSTVTRECIRDEYPLPLELNQPVVLPKKIAELFCDAELPVCTTYAVELTIIDCQLYIVSAEVGTAARISHNIWDTYKGDPQNDNGHNYCWDKWTYEFSEFFRLIDVEVTENEGAQRLLVGGIDVDLY